MAEPGGSGVPSEFETVEGIWRAVEAHRAGDPVAALEAWQRVTMPAGSEVWKKVAMSMALLQSHRTEEAAMVLADARQLDSENAVVMYMIGILRLDQSEVASEWYDAIGPTFIRLAVQTPLDLVPHTKSMYEMAAIQAFEQAVEMAHRLRLDMPLVPEEWGISPDYESVMPLAAPRVADVLRVIGAEQFVGKSHLVLGELYTERGAWEHAEEHLDQAREAKMATGVAFRKLGEAYEEAGMYSDASRAYLKARSHDAGVIGPAERALENFRKALLGVF